MSKNTPHLVQQLKITNTVTESNTYLGDVLTESLPLYMYTSLPHPDSIRVITLHPEIKHDPIFFTLASVRLGDQPIYDCLSYTWATKNGDASLSCSVTCDNSLIHVTKNCSRSTPMSTVQRKRKSSSG